MENKNLLFFKNGIQPSNDFHPMILTPINPFLCFGIF
jgi:hypothetical protein